MKVDESRSPDEIYRAGLEFSKDPLCIARAISEFRLACELDPSNIDAWFELGSALRTRAVGLKSNNDIQRDRDLNEALICFSKATSHGERALTAWSYIGQIHHFLYHKKPAIDAYAMVVHKKEDIPDLDELQDMADALLDLKAYDLATELYRNVCDRDPLNLERLLEVGSSLLKYNKEEAGWIFRWAIRAHSDDANL